MKLNVQYYTVHFVSKEPQLQYFNQSDTPQKLNHQAIKSLKAVECIVAVSFDFPQIIEIQVWHARASTHVLYIANCSIFFNKDLYVLRMTKLKLIYFFFFVIPTKVGFMYRTW